MSTVTKSNTYLNWLEDECFFSVCSRQHIFWGGSHPQETLQSIFECDVEYYNHDFPRNLGSLNKNAIAAWGKSDAIIEEHTIAPMFFPFQSTEHVNAHKEVMKGRNLGPIKYKLGLITGRFGGEHPLKACTKCILDDRNTCGVAYWHLTHQLPGVTICPLHHCLLKESTENRQWSRAFNLCIPSESILIEPKSSPLDDDTLSTLRNVSNAAVKLRALGSTARFEKELVAQVYERELARVGTSRRNKEAAARNFVHHCMTLRKHAQFSSLPASYVCALAFISQMTRKPRGYYHPLKHVVLISWLFGGVEAFVTAYADQAKQSEKPKFYSCKQPELSAARRYTKLKVANHTPTLKPKKMFEDVKKRVIASLESGTSKTEICSRFGISISTINRILRLNPMSREKIVDESKLHMLGDQRKQWSVTVFNNPNYGAKHIRSLIPSVYAWLYRNDKAWLSLQTSYLPRRRPGNNSKTDWDYRDENLCTKIKEVLKMRDCGTTVLRKYELYQLVPGLHKALESRPHYPKARALLDQVTQPDFHVHS